MSFLELLLIGVGLSMDAFAVAICQGLSMPRLNWRHAGVIGLFFGGLGTMIAGFAALGGGMGLLFSSVPNGILMIGVSLLCISCGAFLAALALWVTTKLVPLAMRAVRWLWHRLFGNGR